MTTREVATGRCAFLRDFLAFLGLSAVFLVVLASRGRRFGSDKAAGSSRSPQNRREFARCGKLRGNEPA